MCGICGIVSTDPQARFDARSILRMRETLHHRGPDDAGLYLAPGVALGHRRLSIIDLRPEGRQPMSNEDGSVWIVFNGEIYNFAEQRKWLIKAGHQFRSRTDSEVIVHLYEELGIECLQRLRGMFALAIWDQRKRLLMLARDRLGKKPIFYSFDGHNLIFGSEPKAIFAFPGVAATPDLSAINHYMALGYVPSPYCAFSGMRKLPPAHYLTFSNGRIDVHRYWRLRYEPKLRMDEEETCSEILERLTEAIRIRMIADVPLGAFLSGGLDSSAVVALMSRLSPQPVKTFSIGFKERDYDELPYARLVAKQFKTDHHEFVVDLAPIEILDQLVWHYNEPYADSSALPTFYLSKLTRDHVTVALNGDAGDENFAGYQRYTVNLVAHYLNGLPNSVRGSGRLACALIARSLSDSGRLARRFGTLGALLSGSHAYSHLVTICDSDQRTQLLSADFRQLVQVPASEQLFKHLRNETDANNRIDQALDADVNLYLPDDLLVKVDIASMAVGLEARSPMVDHEFMEFVARLPPRFKLQGFRNRKAIFKRALRGLLPEEILTRPKMGFRVPLEHWFRGPMVNMLRDVVLSRRARERGYFNISHLEQLLLEHVSGTRNLQDLLWALLMLELWHRRFIDGQHTENRECTLATGNVTAGAIGGATAG